MFNQVAGSEISGKPFWARVISKKFYAPFTILFSLCCSLMVGLLIAQQGYVLGIIILCGVIALPLAFAMVAYPNVGIVALIILSFFVNQASRILPEPTPIGLVIDISTYLLILGFFVRQRKEHDWSYFKDPISYFVLVWIGYNIFEIFNPVSPSILEWVFTVRTIGFIMLMYFIFLYHIRTKQFIKLLIKLWLVLEIIAAISAFQQENIGLLPFETTWLFRFPGRYKLLFIGGHLRKWGIFSDPVVFAFNMVSGSLLCIAMMFGPIKAYKKVILAIIAIFFLMVMLYSGTRSSYVLVPAALMMVVALNFTTRTLMVTIVLGLFLGFMIMVPTRNPTIARFQSAFKPTHDASFETRAENQAHIKPYILAHPMGGGLGSVGVWGERFAPNSYLSKFPPDSGYERVAVEMGYIGLFIYCLFNFIILYKGINNYFLIKDPELKCYCMAMILIIFALDIGNYPQQSIVQYPTNILFFLAAALLNVTLRLDVEQRRSTPVVADVASPVK